MVRLDHISLSFLVHSFLSHRDRPRDQRRSGKRLGKYQFLPYDVVLYFFRVCSGDAKGGNRLGRLVDSVQTIAVFLTHTFRNRRNVVGGFELVGKTEIRFCRIPVSFPTRTCSGVHVTDADGIAFCLLPYHHQAAAELGTDDIALRTVEVAVIDVTEAIGNIEESRIGRRLDLFCHKYSRVCRVRSKTRHIYHLCVLLDHVY